jgi:hypothetical protein
MRICPCVCSASNNRQTPATLLLLRCERTVDIRSQGTCGTDDDHGNSSRFVVSNSTHRNCSICSAIYKSEACHMVNTREGEISSPSSILSSSCRMDWVSDRHVATLRRCIGGVGRGSRGYRYARAPPSAQCTARNRRTPTEQ